MTEQKSLMTVRDISTAARLLSLECVDSGMCGRSVTAEFSFFNNMSMEEKDVASKTQEDFKSFLWDNKVNLVFSSRARM